MSALVREDERLARLEQRLQRGPRSRHPLRRDAVCRAIRRIPIKDRRQFADLAHLLDLERLPVRAVAGERGVEKQAALKYEPMPGLDCQQRALD